MRPGMPTHEELQAVIGRALVDPVFCKDLLNGHRRERLAEFQLSRDEWEMAASVQASDLTSFAQAVDRWIVSHSEPQRATPDAIGMARLSCFYSAG